MELEKSMLCGGRNDYTFSEEDRVYCQHTTRETLTSLLTGTHIRYYCSYLDTLVHTHRHSVDYFGVSNLRLQPMSILHNSVFLQPAHGSHSKGGAKLST